MESTVDFESDMYVEQARGDTTSPIEVPRGKKTKKQIAKKKDMHDWQAVQVSFFVNSLL